MLSIFNLVFGGDDTTDVEEIIKNRHTDPLRLQIMSVLLLWEGIVNIYMSDMKCSVELALPKDKNYEFVLMYGTRGKSPYVSTQIPSPNVRSFRTASRT